RNRLQAATRIGSLRDEVQAIVRDHPDYVGAYSFLGNYYYRAPWPWGSQGADRKSTRLNSSHVSTSYAVFCLKKKTSPSASASIEHRTCSAVPLPALSSF